MFLLNYGSFYEMKTRHFQKYLLSERRKVQGIFALVCQAPKPFKHTTCEKASEQIISKSNTASTK